MTSLPQISAYTILYYKGFISKRTSGFAYIVQQKEYNSSETA